MPEGFLKFTLPDEALEFERAFKATDYDNALRKFVRFLQKQMEAEGISHQEHAAYVYMSNALSMILQEYGITL